MFCFGSTIITSIDIASGLNCLELSSALTLAGRLNRRTERQADKQTKRETKLSAFNEPLNRHEKNKKERNQSAF